MVKDCRGNNSRFKKDRLTAIGPHKVQFSSLVPPSAGLLYIPDEGGIPCYRARYFKQDGLRFVSEIALGSSLGPITSNAMLTEVFYNYSFVQPGGAEIA
jgi:hypothetical protein